MPVTELQLEAPAEAAVGAGARGVWSHEAAADLLVLGAVPDFTEGLLGGVAEGEAVVTVHGERRDATGEGAAGGGEIHEGPGAAAEGPGRIFRTFFDAGAGFGGAGGVEADAKAGR